MALSRDPVRELAIRPDPSAHADERTWSSSLTRTRIAGRFATCGDDEVSQVAGTAKSDHAVLR